MRSLLPLPEEPHTYNSIRIDRYQLKELRNAAHAFDLLTEETNVERKTPGRLYFATDFIDWVRPDIEPRKLKP